MCGELLIFDTNQQFATHTILRDIPVVVVSGNVCEVPLEGIAAYLCKPMKVERLIEVIDQHCKWLIVLRDRRLLGKV